MQHLEYRLCKEDYEDWIHFNVAKSYSTKRRMTTIGIYCMIVLAFMGINLKMGRGLQSMVSTLGLGVIIGIYIALSTSMKSQEKMVWRKSGLAALEKENRFPVVHLDLQEKGMVMTVPGEKVSKVYGYKDLVSTKELDRLILVETEDHSWQFVAKSVFANDGEKEKFLHFLEEKIEAGKADPDFYTLELSEEEKKELFGEDAEEMTVESAGAKEKASTGAPGENQGKISQMAHLMDGLAEEDDEEEPTEEEMTE